MACQCPTSVTEEIGDPSSIHCFITYILYSLGKSFGPKSLQILTCLSPMDFTELKGNQACKWLNFSLLWIPVYKVENNRISLSARDMWRMNGLKKFSETKMTRAKEICKTAHQNANCDLSVAQYKSRF